MRFGWCGVSLLLLLFAWCHAETLPSHDNITYHAALPLPDSSDTNISFFRSTAHYTPLEQLRRLLPDETELMRSLLHVITSNCSTNIDACTQALLVLQELCEDLDKARDFAKLDNGFSTVVALLEASDARLHEPAAWVLGSAAQNQRELQLHLLNLAPLPPLMRLVRDESAAVSARSKALYALSALTRNCPEGQWQLQTGGLDAVLAAMQSGAPRLARKALVWLSDLVHEHLAAAAAAAAGRPTYDGHEHATRPPLPLAAGVESGEVLCAAVLACLRLTDVDSREKAITALKHLHAAGLLSSGPPCAADVRTEVHRLLEACQRGAADSSRAPYCVELLPALRTLEQQLRLGQPATRIQHSDTVFHLEVL